MLLVGQSNTLWNDLFEEKMGFFTNLLMAIVSAVNPALGFMANVISYIASSAKKAATGLILNLASSFLPGGVVKDILVGSFVDAIEYDSLSSAVSKVTPRNDLALTCDICKTNTHYYVKSDGLIKCSNCFEHNVDKKININDRIFVLKNGLFQMEQQNVGSFSFIKMEKKELYNPDFPSLDRNDFPSFD